MHIPGHCFGQFFDVEYVSLWHKFTCRGFSIHGWDIFLNGLFGVICPHKKNTWRDSRLLYWMVLTFDHIETAQKWNPQDLADMSVYVYSCLYFPIWPPHSRLIDCVLTIGWRSRLITFKSIWVSLKFGVPQTQLVSLSLKWQTITCGPPMKEHFRAMVKDCLDKYSYSAMGDGHQFMFIGIYTVYPIYIRYVWIHIAWEGWPYTTMWLVVWIGLEHVLFFHMWGIIIPTD